MSIFPWVDPNLQVSHPGGSAGMKSRFCSQSAKVWALFQHLARGSVQIMITLYIFIHWGYLGPSRHPPSLLPILQAQLDSPELWNYMQVAPNFSSVYTMTIMMCVSQKIPHLSDTMSLGFWRVSEQPWRCCTREEAAEQLQCFRDLCGKEWETGNMGQLGEIFLLVLQWGYRLFLPWCYLGRPCPPFHTEDLFQKTIVVLGPVWSSLWKVKDTFHMAFLQVIDRSFNTTLSVIRPMLSSDSGFCHCSWYYVQILYLPLHLFSLQEGTVWKKWSSHLLANLDVPAGPWNPFC